MYVTCVLDETWSTGSSHPWTDAVLLLVEEQGMY